MENCPQYFPYQHYLNRMGIKDSKKCDFCGEKDHLEHYFFECSRIKPLWLDIKQIITNKTNKIINLNMQIILLGIEQDIIHLQLCDSDIRFIKNVLLIGKYSVIKSKVDNVNIKLTFEKEIKTRAKWLQ